MTLFQIDLLAKASRLKSIDDIASHAEAFETALRDQLQLQQLSDIHAARMPSYRRNKHRFPQQRSMCSGCGSITHGIPGIPPRHSNSPTWTSCVRNTKQLIILQNFAVSLLKPAVFFFSNLLRPAA